MTDNEIIKAIEICAKAECWGDCEDMCCPAASKQGCRFYLRTDEDYEGVIQMEMLKDALDLINRQKAEIERLHSEVKEKTETIVFLKDQSTGWSIDFCNLKAKLNTAKAEAIKEFAERLKDTKFKHGSDYIIYAENIDNLVKEMTEGINGRIQ